MGGMTSNFCDVIAPYRAGMLMFQHFCVLMWQFASDLDESSRKQLERGQRMVEILKQPPYSPLPVEKQVVVIYAGAKGYLDDIAVSNVVPFEAELYPFLEAKYPEIFEQIRSKQVLNPEIEELLAKALNEFKTTFAVK